VVPAKAYKVIRTELNTLVGMQNHFRFRPPALHRHEQNAASAAGLMLTTEALAVGTDPK
jgi:hypothetical protein